MHRRPAPVTTTSRERRAVTVANIVCVWALVGGPALQQYVTGHLGLSGVWIVLAILAGMTALISTNHYHRR